LTSIFTLADATKLQEKFRLSKDFKWADCVESKYIKILDEGVYLATSQSTLASLVL
jgi:hypothetical protein